MGGAPGTGVSVLRTKLNLRAPCPAANPEEGPQAPPSAQPCMSSSRTVGHGLSFSGNCSVVCSGVDQRSSCSHRKRLAQTGLRAHTFTTSWLGSGRELTRPCWVDSAVAGWPPGPGGVCVPCPSSEAPAVLCLAPLQLQSQQCSVFQALPPFRRTLWQPW